MQRSNYEVQVLVNGNPVKEYYKDGQVYIEGKQGQRYSIKIKNNGSRRILAVPTVDGLSVMDGKPASLKSNGYIIDGYDSLKIEGWRTSDKEVAEFFFSCSDHAYSELKGEGQNKGVVGVAIFEEKEYVKYSYSTGTTTITGWPWGYYNDPFDSTFTFLTHSTPTLGGSGSIAVKNSDFVSTGINTSVTGNASLTGSSVTNNAFNLSTETSSSSPKQELGTGFGDQKKSEVTKVTFHRESGPITVFEIFYNTRKELEKLGIDFNTKQVYIPSAFPGEYCEPPKKNKCCDRKNCNH